MGIDRTKDYADLIGDAGLDPISAELTTKEAADLFGIGIRTVQVLLSKGTLQRTASGYLDTRDSVRAYLAFCRRGAGESLETEKLRLMREQADKVELQNQKIRGELLPAADVEHEWATALRDLRAALLALPSRVHARLPHLSTHDIQIIDREIRDALTELAGHE